MKVVLGDISVGLLVVSVWLVRSIPHSGVCGMIDVLMFEKLESYLDVRSLGIDTTTTFYEPKPAIHSLFGLIPHFPLAC
jgi:hypothetical protein